MWPDRADTEPLQGTANDVIVIVPQLDSLGAHSQMKQRRQWQRNGTCWRASFPLRPTIQIHFSFSSHLYCWQLASRHFYLDGLTESPGRNGPLPQAAAPWLLGGTSTLGRKAVNPGEREGVAA